MLFPRPSGDGRPARMILRSVLTASLLACMAGVATAGPREGLPQQAEILESRQVVALATGVASRRLLVEWQGMLSRGEDARLATAWIVPAPDAPAWECATLQLLDALAVGAPRDALDPVLAALSTHVPVAYVRHAETASDWFVPAFEVARSAAALRHAWSVERGAREWERILASGGAPLEARIKRTATDASDADALRLAVQRADAGTLRKRAADLQQADIATAAPGTLAALALRTHLPGDYAAALAYERPSNALDLVAAAPRQLREADAVAFLEDAAAVDELASAATLALGSLAVPGASALDLLVAAVGDPRRGESAAAALARIDEPRMFDGLVARLRVERDAVAQRHLVLYLRLRGDAPARDAALEFAASPRATPELAREVASW
jgi:hypothetical protein